MDNQYQNITTEQVNSPTVFARRNVRTDGGVPIWKKMALTIEEASVYSNIGLNKLRNMCDDPCCPFVLYVGRKKLIKRMAFEDYLNKRFEV